MQSPFILLVSFFAFFEVVLIRTSRSTESTSAPGGMHGKFCHKKKVVFLKTHKTGSSTIFNILSRLSLKRNYSVAIPKRLGDADFEWPRFFQASFVAEASGGVDIIMSHMRYSKSELELLFPREDTFYFTIIRDPPTQWLSTIYYFGLDRSLRITDKNSLKSFLRRGIKPHVFQILSSYNNLFNLARNPILFDLGIPSMFETNPQMMEKSIMKLDEDFDFVMVMEKFDHSLLLLKKMLCLDDDDILYLRINENFDSIKSVIDGHLSDPEVPSLIDNFNRGDAAIYKHFRRKFEAMAKEVNSEVGDFQASLQSIRDVCINKRVKEVAYGNKYYNGYELNKGLNENDTKTCQDFTRSELRFLRIFIDKYINSK